MYKKIAATTAVLTIALTALTGCGGGKLSTEETCKLMNDKFIEANLKEDTEKATQKLLAGDTADYVAVVEKMTDVMSEAADKTDDQKLADALNAAQEQTGQVLEVMKDDSLDIMELSQKMSEMNVDESKTAYLSTACPDLDALD